VLYLTEARQVTGEVLHVDGGAHVGNGSSKGFDPFPGETAPCATSESSFHRRPRRSAPSSFKLEPSISQRYASFGGHGPRVVGRAPLKGTRCRGRTQASLHRHAQRPPG
jgi:hypothetical protein